MKRIIVLFTLLFIVVITFIERSNNSAEGMNDLMLENIEVLAGNEGSSSIHCMGNGCVVCPIGNVKVYMYFEAYSLK